MKLKLNQSLAALLFSASVFTACAPVAEQTLSVTPVPMEVNWQRGSFRPDASTSLWIEAPEADRSILAEYLQASPLALKLADSQSGNQVVLKQTDALEGITSPEGYVLSVNSDGVRIEALSGAGLFYGVQTLLQMAADAPEGMTAVTVKDEPRFEYRGIMLDVSRHFRSKEFVKRQIDLLSYYKINRLHLHLTDAAGWRIEIKKYPRLTQFAAWRPQAVWKDWWNGKREYCEETDPRAQGGYYTQDDIRELVAYAQKHYVTIIPEIEMPSHSEESADSLSGTVVYACAL